MHENPATATPLLTPARLASAILTFAVMIAGLFWVAGRWDWGGGWAYVVAIVSGSAASEFAVWRSDPDVIRARARMGEGTKTWDKICLSLYLIFYVAILIVGALDAGRYGWSDMPGWLIPVGIALVWLSQAALAWCMIVNRYFEKTVRLQTDRGHTVIRSGPYRYVRHPGYAAAIAGYIAGVPFILGSWWAFAPALAAAIVLVVRTALEDRMLHAELAGYPDYARAVRYRLVPGIW
jgi:protein-S-isoprenylcysteine O-methyltransferase Ste14